MGIRSHAILGAVSRRLDNQLDKFFNTSGSPQIAEIRSALWRVSGDPDMQATDFNYCATLEQYKVYVEMADRISARRALTNTFFLGLNTMVLTSVSIFWQDHPAADPKLVVIPWSALVLQCLAWFWLLRSYRQLNTAKYAVIGALEERLPASPYWKAEWVALGEGRDPSRYWPLSNMEQIVPALFAAVYTTGALLVLLA